MLSDRSKLGEIFEQEVWLYLSQELSEARMEFWDQQISSSVELKSILNESKQILNIYGSETLVDIDDPIFDGMISNATKPSLISKMKKLFSSNDEKGISFHKVALATTLSIAALIMLLLNDKPNQVKTISNELLEWNAGSLTEQMNEIEMGISLVDKDNYKRYMLLKMKDESWNKNVFSIGKDLEKMKQELDDISM